MRKEYLYFQRLHSTYENRAYRIILKEFRALFKSLPYKNITPENAYQVVLLNINDENLQKAVEKLYLNIGLSYGNIVYKQLKEEKRNYPLFSQAFQTFVTNYFLGEGYALIKTLTETMAKEVFRVVGEISKTKTDIFEFTKAIEKVVNNPNFYKWQALRIARTETTTAMNSAKYIAGDVSGLVLDKVWMHGGGREPRPEHIDLDGTAIGQFEDFIVNGLPMQYPGDRRGGAINCVNCRCTYAYRPKRDSNGNLMIRI